MRRIDKRVAIEFLPRVRERETGDGGGIEREGGGGETETLMAEGNTVGEKKICPSSIP